ncbi:DUF4595 domain-containing protein [Niabella aurantiaca]|uniref:DUF4595 domain-containing protein n=1 Tax=Niabella aurantiaca TaxID=379900 RepID=UPI000382721A|nr:DUF4595 domain-containing protein [Niabella aurantiaca]
MTSAYFLPVLAFIAGLSGPATTPAPLPGCRITGMTSDAEDTLRFLYDAKGRVQRITGRNGYFTRFDYCSNTIVATETRNDSLLYKRVMTLGCNGMMSNLFEETWHGGITSWAFRSYTFSGTALTGITTVLSSGAAPIQATLTWNNGNFISETSNDVKRELDNGYRYEYYTDKLVQPGDYWYINLLPTLGRGDKLYRNKNLLKSIRSENGIITISYQFDKDGKIISMTKTTGNSSKTWHYEYQCG